jgi:uncharacterized protein YaiI (UPF0178 family)
MDSDYSEVKIIGAGADAVDFALVNLCKKLDIVVTQDYGVAAMALSKGAYAIHQSGKWYADDNIDRMLMERHINKKSRMASGKNHIEGCKRSGGPLLCTDRSGSGDPRKRTEADNDSFRSSFIKLIAAVRNKEETGGRHE